MTCDDNLTDFDYMGNFLHQLFYDSHICCICIFDFFFINIFNLIEHFLQNMDELIQKEKLRILEEQQSNKSKGSEKS